MEAKKKRPDLAVVIGMGKPKKDRDSERAEDMKDEDGDEGAHEDAMGEMIEAQKSGDLPRAVEAFRTLYDLCKSDHEESSEE